MSWREDLIGEIESITKIISVLDGVREISIMNNHAYKELNKTEQRLTTEALKLSRDDKLRQLRVIGQEL